MCDVVLATRPQWTKVLDELPATPEKIPALPFAHGRTFSVPRGFIIIMKFTYSRAFHPDPMLIWPKKKRPISSPMDSAWDRLGPDGTLSQFPQDSEKTLQSKYNPRAVAAFSAHCETHGQTLGEYLKWLSFTFDSTYNQ